MRMFNLHIKGEKVGEPSKQIDYIYGPVEPNQDSIAEQYKDANKLFGEGFTLTHEIVSQDV